jgi:hypothetical protein
MSNYITHKNDVLLSSTPKAAKVNLNSSRNSSRESSPGRRGSSK